MRNVLFEDFVVEGADAGPAVSEDSGDDDGKYAGTSLMEVSNVAFVGFTGWLSGKSGDVTSEVSCSEVVPCYNIDLKNVALRTVRNETGFGVAKCEYIEPGGVHGVSGSGC